MPSSGATCGSCSSCEGTGRLRGVPRLPGVPVPPVPGLGTARRTRSTFYSGPPFRNLKRIDDLHQYKRSTHFWDSPKHIDIFPKKKIPPSSGFPLRKSTNHRCALNLGIGLEAGITSLRVGGDDDKPLLLMFLGDKMLPVPEESWKVHENRSLQNFKTSQTRLVSLPLSRQSRLVMNGT